MRSDATIRVISTASPARLAPVSVCCLPKRDRQLRKGGAAAAGTHPFRQEPAGPGSAARHVSGSQSLAAIGRPCPFSTFALRFGAALLMGAGVGLERQWRQRMAGTRTTALVAAGAAAFVMCAFMRFGTRPEARRRLCPMRLRCRISWRGSHLQGCGRRPWIEYGCHHLVFRCYRSDLRIRKCFARIDPRWSRAVDEYYFAAAGTSPVPGPGSGRRARGRVLAGIDWQA